jgi:hypothetical protein
MSEKPINPLRQRMIEDMYCAQFRREGPQRLYPPRQDSPDTATAEDLRHFQLHQRHSSGVRPPTINGSVAALRFSVFSQSVLSTAPVTAVTGTALRTPALACDTHRLHGAALIISGRREVHVLQHEG